MKVFVPMMPYIMLWLYLKMELWLRLTKLTLKK